MVRSMGCEQKREEGSCSRTEEVVKMPCREQDFTESWALQKQARLRIAVSLVGRDCAEKVSHCVARGDGLQFFVVEVPVRDGAVAEIFPVSV